MNDLIESLRRLSAIKGRPFTVAERAEAAIAMSEAAAALEAAREALRQSRPFVAYAFDQGIVGADLAGLNLDAAIDQARKGGAE